MAKPSLQEMFAKAEADISSKTPRGYHYPLLQIMRDISGHMRAEYDSAGLIANDIDPSKFLQLWATGYAKETLGYDKSIPFVKDIINGRCKVCLEKEGEFAFKDVLPEDIKNLLREKLASQSYGRNSGYTPPSLD